MGAVFFPALSGVCGSPLALSVAPAAGRASRVLEHFDATAPSGPTPTRDAVRFAGAQLSEGAGRAHVRSLVLATDGEPTCDDLDPVGGVVAAVADLARRGVPTYVIGIANDGGDLLAGALDRMAVAGGRPNPRGGAHAYYSALRPEDLAAALTAVQRAIASCTFVTSAPPSDPGQARLSVGASPVARDPAHREGWDWTDAARGELAFFGSACERAVASPNAITIETPCPSGR